ncbi:MAG: ABC transporter permease [Desulfobacteraceae bacterium]|nr:MAG: ABC transporter permease [Desulfobacteraceae bacterium]
MRIWIYFFRQTFINIANNRLIHAISIGTMIVSLLLLGAFMLFFINVYNWMEGWSQSLSVSVYLRDGIGESAKKQIEAAIKNIPGAVLKEFISKEEALKQLSDALGSQAGLLNSIARNPLPASFEVVFKNITKNQIDPKRIKTDLEKLSGVEEVQYSEQWLDRFEGFLSVLKLLSAIIGGFLCLAVLFIVTNTIKLTIYSRRDEIEIYKLVGATDWFIKIPFLLEGLIHGLVSGLIALLTLFSLYTFISSKTIQLFGLPAFTLIFLKQNDILLIMALSLCLGLLGSFIAIGRFFKI